jgi:hypothetical protein
MKHCGPIDSCYFSLMTIDSNMLGSELLRLHIQHHKQHTIAQLPT